MDEEESNNRSRKCSEKRSYSYQFHHHLFKFGNGGPALLPLPPTIPLHLTLAPSPYPQNQIFDLKTNIFIPSWKHTAPTSSHCQAQDLSTAQDVQRRVYVPFDGRNGRKATFSAKQISLAAAKRPDSGGVEGRVIKLLANHFLVEFDPSQRLFHYDVEISPNPSKDVARMIKSKLVEEHSHHLCGALPVFDGRRTLYSPIEFIDNRLEFHISLPILQQHKIFRVNIKLVSKLDGTGLSSYVNKGGDDDDCAPLPQEYIHALNVVLRERPNEKCITVGRSFYSSSMGGVKEIGGGVVALRGFFQSLRPTQQGLALNVDFSVTAFHESIGVIPFLQKQFDFMHDICRYKARSLVTEERIKVEKALKNLRVFVCHRETVQKYRVYSLTDETTENLFFPDRDGKSLRLVNYYKEHYGYNVVYLNLPCLQISRRKPCYLPMELCVICEGQKFLGKLSDDQTAKILKLGCQRPIERKAIIDQVMEGPVGPTRGDQVKNFKLRIRREMTQLSGRVLQPPKLKLGNGGLVRNLTPLQNDRQWNLIDSQVFEGTRIERWGVISFGGTADQRSSIPRFIKQLSQRCEKLGIFLPKNTTVCPIFESMHVLGNSSVLESKLKRIQRSSMGNLQLLICIMERKHKGYADLKRITETGIGIVSQCCLYHNLGKLTSQFLANIALKINAKFGGCTVALYNSLPSQMPRLFTHDDPVIFMGADVTHPHPLDDVSPSVAAVVGSINWPAANKYVSRMRSQTHRQEIIQDLCAMVGEILDDFYNALSVLPPRIIFFRDGVSETQFNKVMQDELQAIRRACCLRFPSYKPLVTFIVVQKRHHTRLFPCRTGFSSDENVPPGTVVDTMITHPREFDFYLCSHWGVKGTSRPIHYHVLWDENQFTSDEAQKLVYNLCYTFVRCTKPISLVPPAYYAHLAANRGRLYLERWDASTNISRISPPKTVPLPKLSENIKKLMFYC